jgi:pimeloyl-ACP methyl ester carboxylesterase
MPAVFVHGVPDTHHLWDEVRSLLSRKDTVAVSLPNFGVGAPEGFGSTKEEYLAWLIAELEAIGETVDLVGHDWGALLTERLVQVRPDLVKSWAAGGAAIDEGYVWHPAAQMWQTPGMGEQFMEGMTPDAFVAAVVPEGVPEKHARETAERIDDRMKASILTLYRSAVNYMKEWHADVEKMPSPGLLIWGEKDPYMQIEFARKMSQRSGAKLVVLEGCGHWWPAQRPAETAEALEAFWAEG